MKKYLIVFIFLFFTACTQNAVEKQPESTPLPTLMATPISTKSPEPLQEIKYWILSDYTSPMTSKDKNRIYNIKLASEKLNLHIIEAGDTMSFNDIVGDTNEKQGYKKAIIYVDGKKQKGYGGGVCQLSSTLYNAALIAEMEIVERHTHNGPDVTYVPKDMDATVAFGLKDLKIKNNLNKPIRVRTEINNNGVGVVLEIKEN